MRTKNDAAGPVGRTALHLLQPANGVVEAVVAPEQLAVDKEARRTEDAERLGLFRRGCKISLGVITVGLPKDRFRVLTGFRRITVR